MEWDCGCGRRCPEGEAGRWEQQRGAFSSRFHHDFCGLITISSRFPSQDSAGEPRPRSPSAHEVGWYYQGGQGETRGPEPLANMQSWFVHGYLPTGTMLRRGEMGDFKDVSEFLEITSAADTVDEGDEGEEEED